MIFTATIKINEVRWVRQEEKTISILVQNGEQEIDLNIERGELEKLRGMTEQCLRGEAKPDGEQDGSFSVYIMADDERASIDLARDDDLPFPATLIFKGTGGREFRLSFDATQARVIQEKLETFIHVDEELSRIKNAPNINNPSV